MAMTLEKLAEIVLDLTHKVDKGFAHVDKRLTNIEADLKAIKFTVAGIDKAFARLEKTVANHQVKIKALETAFKSLK